MTEQPELDEDGDTAAGHFSVADRATAIRQSLPLLTSYFADAPTWALRTQQQLAQGSGDTFGQIANFVRMRVALASLARLEPVLEAILARPSFYYDREIEESTGHLRGALDMTRYIRTRLRPESPRRYPVRVIHRRFTTAENTAAAYAALLMARDLSDAPLHVLPPRAPEYRGVLAALAQLRQWLGRPALSQNRQAAVRVRREGRLTELIVRGRQRIYQGRVASPERYLRLFEWLEVVSDRSAEAAPGEIEWSFYDQRFDTKLFEIWSLGQLIEACECELGQPIQSARSLLERASSPIRTWSFGAVKIRLYFQPGLARLSGGPPRWRITEPKSSVLGGFPDLGVTVTPIGQAAVVILIDPKLRQRKSAPSDELYKLVGYFGNLPPQIPKGAIIYYSPSGATTYRLERDDAGEMLAVGIDLADPSKSSAGFERIAALIRSAAAVPPEIVSELAANTGDASDIAEERGTAVRQRFAVQSMATAAAALPPSSLAPIEKTTSASLGAIWERLSPNTRRMLVTAEFFGATAPKEADHSGPLLGLAAACEGVIAETLFDDLVAKRPDLFNPGATFGTMIHWLTDSGRRTPRDPTGRYLSAELARKPAVKQDQLWRMTGELRRINVDFRIPAAHREVVSQALWAEGRRLILDATTGVLAKLVNATQAE